MRQFKKLFASKEVKAALGLLDEASCKFDSTHGYHSTAFQLIREQIEKIILSNSAKFTHVIQKGTSPRQWIYAAISNIAGDYVESGNYHIYRGVLNPLGPGQEFLRLFDDAIDELKKIGSWTEEQAEKEKRTIRDSIKGVG